MKSKELKEVKLLLQKSETVLTTRFLWMNINWKLSKMTLGRMLKLAEVYTSIMVDEDAVKSEDSGEQLAAMYKSVKDNAKLAAKVLSIGVDSWIPKRILRWYFLKSVDPSQLQQFTLKILQTSNFANFTTSIFLMNGSRITKPKKIEK